MKSSREFYSILVCGPFGSGKSTFLNAACSEVGGMMLQHGRIATVGQFALNEKLGVYLYELSHFHLDLRNVPGKLLGCVVIINKHWPETFHEAKSIIDFCPVYAIAPVTVVMNTHSYGERESWSKSWTEQDFRFALQIDNSIPFIECDVSNSESVKAVLETVGQRFLVADDVEPKGTLLPNVLLDEQDFLSMKQTHRFLMVVSTEIGYAAHAFMDALSDHITWLKLDDRNIPRRWGSCELDSSMYLHLMPVERFGSPKDIVGFAFQSLLAMAGERPHPSQVEEQNLPYNEGIIGCVGLFSSYDAASIERTQYMVNAFADYPYVLIDTGRWSLNEPAIHNLELDEAYLGSRHPIMRVDSKDKDFPRRVLCLLDEQLTGIEAEKLHLKYGCLSE